MKSAPQCRFWQVYLNKCRKPDRTVGWEGHSFLTVACGQVKGQDREPVSGQGLWWMIPPGDLTAHAAA
jgi:hypothetical protein